jgi:hypothetical protein
LWVKALRGRARNPVRPNEDVENTTDFPMLSIPTPKNKKKRKPMYLISFTFHALKTDFHHEKNEMRVGRKTGTRGRKIVRRVTRKT